MLKSKNIKDFLFKQGHSLSTVGVDGIGFMRKDALQLVELLSEVSLPILGGDVYFLMNGYIEVSYDNWYCQQLPSEDSVHYHMRTYSVAEDYIKSYEAAPGRIPLFNLVFPFEVVDVASTENDRALDVE